MEKFFVSVDDVTFYSAKYDVEKQEIIFTREDPHPKKYDYRVMADKFSKDIPTAIHRVLCENSYEEMENSEFAEFISENLTYDKNKNAYILKEFITLGTMQPPKQCQWDEFYKGNYKFNVISHEIQVFETCPTVCESIDEIKKQIFMK